MGSHVLTYAALTDSLRGHYPANHFLVVADVLVKEVVAAGLRAG